MYLNSVIVNNQQKLLIVGLLLYRFDVTIIPAAISTREQVLEALPGHDALFLASHHAINAELLDIAGALQFKYIPTYFPVSISQLHASLCNLQGCNLCMKDKNEE